MSLYRRLVKRIAARREQAALAKKDYQKAQRAYERARRADLHPREQLRHARDAALGRWRKARDLVGLAKRSAARHKPGPKQPKVYRTKLSPCRSSRNGVKPRIIVLHITVSHNRPGKGDVDVILDYFGQPSTMASSHIINDAEGNCARCVPDGDKAWTQAAYNSQALSIEQVEWDRNRPRSDWFKLNQKQLDNTAAWVAWWAKKYDIPLVHSTTHGVCEHMDLGAAGGGHDDCGPGFPLDYILTKARSL